MRGVMITPFPECSFRLGNVLSALQEKANNTFFFFFLILELLCEVNTIYHNFREKQNREVSVLLIAV